jgi:hypothetical protein
VTGRRFTAVLAGTLVSAYACQMPRFQGPQIQSPPSNFIIAPDNQHAQTLFPERSRSFQTTWVHTDLGGTSVINVDEYGGGATLDDAVAAQDRIRATATDPDTVFGGIEAITVDGRRGWGWAERVESAQRGLVQVAYRAIVPYDSVSYTIEFISGEPSLKAAAPDTLRAIVTSFAVGRTRYNLPQIAIAFGVLAVGIGMLRGRAQARRDRLRRISLVTIPKEEPQGDEQEPQDHEEEPQGHGEEPPRDPGGAA